MYHKKRQWKDIWRCHNQNLKLFFDWLCTQLTTFYLQGILVSEKSYSKSDFKILKNRVQCEREAAEPIKANNKSLHCTVLGIQWFLVQKAAGTRSVWPSTVSEAEWNHYWHVQYSFCHKDPFCSASSKLLPIISHPGDGLVAEPSSLSSSAAYLLNNPCRGGLKTQHDNLNMT